LRRISNRSALHRTASYDTTLCGGTHNWTG